MIDIGLLTGQDIGFRSGIHYHKPVTDLIVIPAIRGLRLNAFASVENAIVDWLVWNTRSR